MIAAKLTPTLAASSHKFMGLLVPGEVCKGTALPVYSSPETWLLLTITISHVDEEDAVW